MPKLYEVTVTAYVLANDEDDAENAVKYSHILELDSCDVGVEQAKYLRRGWRDSHPFKSLDLPKQDDPQEDRMTCVDWIDEQTKKRDETVAEESNEPAS